MPVSVDNKLLADARCNSDKSHELILLTGKCETIFRLFKKDFSSIEGHSVRTVGQPEAVTSGGKISVQPFPPAIVVVVPVISDGKPVKHLSRSQKKCVPTKLLTVCVITRTH